MKVIVHYPTDEKAKEELKKRVAEVHSDHVISYIRKQPWTNEQKLAMLNAIVKKYS